MTHVIAVEHVADPVVEDLGFGQPVVVRAVGWHASCDCGWKGNNPHTDEAAANESAAYHEGTAE